MASLPCARTQAEGATLNMNATLKCDRSIIVPCYNEGQNLPALVDRFARLWRPGDSWELVVVDNGSVDETSRVLASEIARGGREFVRVVTVPSPNVGYGHGIITGLRAASGKYLAWTHADGQTPPADALKALDLLAAADNPEKTFVKGRRRGRPLKDRLFTRGMDVAATSILGLLLTDINAQPKAFARPLLEFATFPPHDMSLDLYFYWLARQRGFQIVTFDVDFGVREHGESKWALNWRSTGRNIWRTLTFMTALRSDRARRSS